MREAIDPKVAFEEYKTEAIAKGMLDIKEGRTVSHGDVVAKMQRLKEEHETYLDVK